MAQAPWGHHPTVWSWWGVAWTGDGGILSVEAGQEGKCLAQGSPPIPTPSCLCFLPRSPPPSHSFLLPLVCPCPVWIDPDLLLSPAFPSHSSVLSAHPHFTPPQITSCLYGGSGGGGSSQEPVSQHCPQDWSLALAPRPRGGARQLQVQPILPSAQGDAPRWAGMGLETVWV